MATIKKVAATVAAGSIAASLGGCGDLNIEVQQTQRVSSTASRNPIAVDSELQGSQRIDDRMSVGTEIDSSIAKHISESATGTEK